ncbi:MAG: NAD(P)-binding domain-containing protein, partial [Treponema sp.]|nr:NAD(P)-binding domain-containing protein [Treponema sp.]
VQVFSDLLTEFTGRQNLKKRNVTLIGAGSMARIIASELYKRNARVLVLNRSIHMARDLAARYNFAWGGLDIRGIEMVEKFRDIIIEATSVGTYENDSGEPVDPLELYAFSGREAVIDLAWGPEPTRFLARAAEAGCRTTDGYDMLSRQAQYQYAQFMGRDIPPQLLSRVQYGRS